MRTFTEEEVEEMMDYRVCEKPKTNADRIRHMSDEELTELIIGLNDHCLAGIGLCDCSGEHGYCSDICEKKTKEWIQSEVEE